MPTFTDGRPQIERAAQRRIWASVLAITLLGECGCGEPSPRALKNRQELEALLTAVSLKQSGELERDARRIADRHDAGELSESRFQDLQTIIQKARDGQWAAAEKRAYELREAYPFFQ